MDYVFKSLFERTRFKLGCNVQNAKTWTYSTSRYVYIFWKVIRGGISDVSNKYSKANNKCLKSCNPKQESKYTIYLYANKSYCYALFRFLPTGVFKWIDPKEIDLNKYTSNNSKECTVEVHLQYPKELRKLHND